MDGKGISPIVERLLLPNHLLALEYREGWLFARVVRRRMVHYKPYSLIDSAGTVIDIAAASAQGEVWLRDPRNPSNDVLYLDGTTDSGFPWLLHGAIGWKPHQILVYPRIPEGADIPGKFPNIDPIKPSAGDFTGYYSGHESPYDEPTDFMEYVIRPGTHIGHEFYNLDNRTHNPVANILFALYHLQLFKPALTGVAPHNRIIRDIALRHVPAAFLTVGFTSHPLDLGDTVIKDWDAVPITLDEAQALEVG